MEQGLKGKKVAILATDGVEQVELLEPKAALENAGAKTEVISLKGGTIQAMNHDDKGEKIPVDRELADVSAADYDALLLPGGVANPDRLRTDRRAVNFVRDFFERDKPVAAICHGPWLLVEAGVLEGRTITSWPSLKTDIENAGGTWVDKTVQVDQKLVTSRKPDDIPHFNARILQTFTSGMSERQVDATVEQSFPASDPPPGPISAGA
ncbi:MAG: type 1 glutamine amidotransferase [Gemmatimonadaceae bacterium]|nr:type 1 glutamine amidotransferase [Gemmatimonadaceae bacterium]